MTSIYDPTEDELAFARASMPAPEAKKTTSVSQSKYSPTDEEMAFAQSSMDTPLKPDIPWYQSYPRALGKGIVQGLVSAGESIGQLINPDQFGEQNQFGHVLGVNISGKEPERFNPLPEETHKEIKSELEKKYPSNEGFIEGTLERGGKLAPTALVGTGGLVGKLGRTAVASAAGESAKEAGLGESGQTIAEILAFSMPSLSNTLIGSSPRQKEIINFAKQMGLSEKEIAPALQKESTFRRHLARFAYTGKGTQDRLQKSKKALGGIYEELKISPEAGNKIPKSSIAPMMSEYAKEFKELNPTLQNQLKPAFKNLLESKGLGEDFIRFYQHAYQEVSDPKRIGKFQDVTRRALDSISPELGKDFRLTNELYSNILSTGHMLRAPSHPDVMLYVKGMSALYGLWTGDYTWLAAATTPLIGRKIATEYLLNPNLQNLGAKTTQALNNNKILIANKFLERFKDEAKKSSPDLYEEIKDLKAENLIPKKGSQKQ